MGSRQLLSRRRFYVTSAETRLTSSRRGQRFTTSSATATNVSVHVDVYRQRRQVHEHVDMAVTFVNRISVFGSRRSSSSSTMSSSRLYRLTEQLELTLKSESNLRHWYRKIHAESYDWAQATSVTWSAKPGLDHVTAIKWQQKVCVSGEKNLKDLKH